MGRNRLLRYYALRELLEMGSRGLDYAPADYCDRPIKALVPELGTGRNLSGNPTNQASECKGWTPPTFFACIANM